MTFNGLFFQNSHILITKHMKSAAISQEISVLCLIPLDAGQAEICLQFNPTEISTKSGFNTQENPGANNEESGTNKVSFQGKPASTLSFSTVFDTDDSEEDVVEKHIKPLEKATQFIQKLKRPPVFKLVWGQKVHRERVFVTGVSYKLAKFLGDGTPVRAFAEISLKEVDDAKATNKAAAGAPNPTTATRLNPQQGPSGSSLLAAISDPIDDPIGAIGKIIDFFT
jgi:Contractile injection system tube protein